MNVLVLGSTGFIGSHLCQHLQAQGEEVIGVYQRKTKFMPSYVSYLGDFGDSILLKKIFSYHQVDVVVHLISNIVPASTPQEVQDAIHTDLGGTFNLLQKMDSYDVRKIVFVSTGGAIYGNNNTQIQKEDAQTKPQDSYGWLKQCIEALIQQTARHTDLSWVIARPANAYGVGQRVDRNQGLIAHAFESIKTDKPISIWGDGTQVRDYIYIDDLVEALSRLTRLPFRDQIINLGTGTGHSVNQVIQIIEKITGKTVNKTYTKKNLETIQKAILDVNKLKHTLKWSPTISLEQGVAKIWKQFHE